MKHSRRVRTSRPGAINETRNWNVLSPMVTRLRS